MAGFEGKVAFITGAGRGQGRAHAYALADEGVDILALDICEQPISSIGYKLATEAELDETIAGVQARGRRAVKAVADVRDFDQVQAAVDDGIARLGKIDIVCANAGIAAWAKSWEMTTEQWHEMIDVNLTGVFNTTRAALPSMVERGSGNVVLTSSSAGIIGYQNISHYSAAKHGVIGLMKCLAQELGPLGIRVNAVCPTSVKTPMTINDELFELFAPGVENPTLDDVQAPFNDLNVLDVAWMDPEDVSAAVVWLCSDAARWVTGVALPVDAGTTIKKM